MKRIQSRKNVGCKDCLFCDEADLVCKVFDLCISQAALYTPPEWCPFDSDGRSKR